MSYIYTRGKTGEIDRIREAADIAFEADRGRPFTFLTVMPKIYRLPDHEHMHHLVKDGERIVAVAGNLLEEYHVNGHAYPISFVGSVSVIPEYQKQGLMIELMKKIEEENLEKRVPFSMLTGNRNRYEYFNYYYTGMSYGFTFNRGNIIHEPTFSLDRTLRLSEFKNTPEELDALFSLYEKHTRLVSRTKANFVYSLTNHDNKLYKILAADRLVGYLAVKKELTCIEELVLSDESKLLSVLWAVFGLSSAKEIRLTVYGFEHARIAQVMNYCDDYSLHRDLLACVYDPKAFLRFAFDLNVEKKLEDGSLVLTVEDENILIEVKGGKATVSDADERGVVLTKKQFAELFSMDYFVKEHQIKSWFPLPVAVSGADKF